MNTHEVQNLRVRRSPEVEILEMKNNLMKNFNYLIVEPVSRKSVIIDPAWQMEKIDRALRECKSTLEGVLLTHSHPDHIHLAKDVAKKYRCPIWMSAAEIEYSGFYAEELIAIENSSWLIGELEIRVLFTPGHTSGSVCYLIGNNLFTGDTLFAEGCGMCPSLQDAEIMYESLDMLKRELKPDTRVYPGHSYGKSPGQLFSTLMRDNLYLQFKRKDMFAAFRMRSGQNASSIFNFA